MTTNKIKRYIIFFIGVFINSLGVSVITKADLGTSPISSVPYVLSLNFPFTLGEFTIAVNMIMVILQLVILRRNFKLEHVLQIPFCVIFGYCIDLTTAMIKNITFSVYIEKMLFLLVGCIILGFGVYLETLANVAMLPGESLVRAISSTWHTDFGMTKIANDVTLTVIAVVLSFIFAHRLNGVREGTIIAAFLVGYIARLCGRKIHRFDKFIAEVESDDVALYEPALESDNWVISIGRQYGSGGHAIGQYLALKLGFSFYDKEIISETAGITGYSEDYIQKNEESMGSHLIHDLFNQMYVYSNTDDAPKDVIFNAQTQVIQDLARKGNCVIVGRCSDYILRDYDHCISLFLHAPMASRVERIIKTEHMEESQAQQAIAHTDRRRADNYNYYTDQTWGYSDHYDLCIDTRLGREFILEAVKTVMAKKEAAEA